MGVDGDRPMAHGERLGGWQGRIRIGLVLGGGNGLSELTASTNVAPRSKPRTSSPTASPVRGGVAGRLCLVGIVAPIRMTSPPTTAATARRNSIVRSRLFKCLHLLNPSRRQTVGSAALSVRLVDLVVRE